MTCPNCVVQTTLNYPKLKFFFFLKKVDLSPSARAATIKSRLIHSNAFLKSITSRWSSELNSAHCSITKRRVFKQPNIHCESLLDMILCSKYSLMRLRIIFDINFAIVGKISLGLLFCDLDENAILLCLREGLIFPSFHKKRT